MSEIEEALQQAAKIGYEAAENGSKTLEEVQEQIQATKGGAEA